MRPVRVLRYALRQYFGDRCPRDSAAIAYRVLFSIGPLAIVLVSIFGLVLRDDTIHREVVRAIARALPLTAAGRNQVEDALSAIATPASAAGLISLVLFAWTASGMMMAIRQGLELAMNVSESRPLVRGKIMDGLLVLGAAVLVLVTVAITVLGDAVERVIGTRVENAARLDTLVGGSMRVAVFALTVVVALLLYRFVPARGLRIRDGVAGAVVTAVLLQAISLASAVIYAKTTKLSVIYGSLTAALFFVYSIYLYSSALLFGAEFAVQWARPRPVSSKELQRSLARAALRVALREVRRIG